MTLIKSISGIRGIVGGKPGSGLTPSDIVKFTAAFGSWLIKNNPAGKKIIVGRDARISGELVSNLVVSTLNAMGINVTDLGLSTTPTVEMAVKEDTAMGGIIITASHNPKQWNALKLLNSDGEFISAAAGQEVLEMAEKQDFEFATVEKIGKYKKDESWLKKHIDRILALPLVDKKSIEAKKYKIVVDAVNSTGGIAVPMLLRALGVAEVVEMYCTPDGKFPHNPEPLPQHLTALAGEVKMQKAQLGIAVDPDVDRLALVCEDGSMFGEEYTLVAVADYVLKNSKGNTVSNLSSTRALKDVTVKGGGRYYASAVGEVNVVEKMKEVNAVIGGEGNGGIIFPELHYGRDALVGIALFLTHLSKFGKGASLLRNSYPDYYMTKNKIELTPDINLDKILSSIKDKYKQYQVNTIDGLKIDFESEWVHLRRSNTEPIIRIYAESPSQSGADVLTQKIMSDIREILKA